jgi:LexA-binding, inner membrane-associated putative hydrolase
VSWVAHDLEPYVFQRKLGKTAGIPFVAPSCSAPGGRTCSPSGSRTASGSPGSSQRGWPGVGFTHSLTFGVAVAATVYLLARSKPWALGLLIGIWLHTLSDSGDTVGTMLFFPWTHHFALGAWRYTAHLGRWEDAAAYYSGPAFVWDALWIALALACWPVLRRSYFHERIAPRDCFWAWSGRLLPEHALVALYRDPFDPSWGGPRWAPAARS